MGATAAGGERLIGRDRLSELLLYRSVLLFYPRFLRRGRNGEKLRVH